MGSGLLQLAVAAALVTGSALFIAEQSQPALHCPPGPSWRQQASLLAGLPVGEAAELDPAALTAVTGLAADAMRRVGWPASTKFARFGEEGPRLVDLFPPMQSSSAGMCLPSAVPPTFPSLPDHTGHAWLSGPLLIRASLPPCLRPGCQPGGRTGAAVVLPWRLSAHCAGQWQHRQVRTRAAGNQHKRFAP